MSAAELDRRRASWKVRDRHPGTSADGPALYVEHVVQADEGCDLDFLTGASGSVVDKKSH